MASSLLLLLISTLQLFLSHKKRQGRLPPGPPALLFIAKFLALRRRSALGLGPLLRGLHARYGPVVAVRLLGTTRVFVADIKLAHRVLVKGGATFADRPPLAEPAGLFNSGTRGISNAPYGSYWGLVRRNLAAQALHPSRDACFAPARRHARDALVRDLLGHGRDGAAAVALRPLFRRALFELLLHMTLGVKLGPEMLDEIQELQQHIVRAISGFPFFSFPAITKRLFRQRWARYVALRRRQEEIFLPLIHARRDDRATDEEDPPCYADSLLSLRISAEGGRPLTDAEVVSLCSEFLNGAADTTLTAVEWIMAELVNHPDMQSKVYEEVNRADRLELDDDQSMPYLKAVVLEGLRLHPPTNILIPHAAYGDGAEIDGYAVPKGTEVHFLVSNFGRDETVWTAAMEFRPERFLDGGEGHGVDVTGTREIKMIPFGAGRRMCPAYRLGMLHVEYFVGSLVRELEWLPAAEGEVVDMAEELDFTTVMKHPLRARVVPRTT
ncbi:hypothetical protein BRADI_1g17130v3 [Brachypodium distachyon]|uniref:Cytochrome P450 n=2 Tax=Brachypodium distachyon TaxID=15368 RepID=I1GQY6_BRADI|nr:hypothetical protein BRADI_1g17130v3 [Brachypodium distachyon]